MRRGPAGGWAATDTFVARGEPGGPLVGIVGLRPIIEDALRFGHVGYAVAPQHRRRGYATALLGRATKALRAGGLCEVLACCYAHNTASRRAMERCGYTLCGGYEEAGTGLPVVRYHHTAPPTNISKTILE